MNEQPSSPGRFAHPCTGRVAHEGFGEFLERELGSNRRNLRLFAAELGREFQAPHLTLVNSGSSANLAAALALYERTGPGKAITAGFTFPTTLNSLLTAGYDVALADTQADGFGLCPQALQKALSQDVKLVCLTHFLGFPGELAQIRELCDSVGAVLLQDACETMDLRIDGQAAHLQGDLTTWSFYHPHHLSSFGGGAILANEDSMHEAVQSFAHWGRQCRCHDRPDLCEAPESMNHHFWYVRRGHNLEMSELNACFGRFQLRDWRQQEALRIDHYRRLYAALSPLSECRVYPLPEASGSPFVFPITLKNRSLPETAAALAERGVEVRTLMGGSIQRHPAYADLPNDGLANCRKMGESSFFVGVHQTLSSESIEQAANHLAEVLG